jgi:hypothetical protein
MVWWIHGYIVCLQKLLLLQAHSRILNIDETRTTIIDELAWTVDPTVRKQTTTTTGAETEPTSGGVRLMARPM